MRRQIFLSLIVFIGIACKSQHKENQELVIQAGDLLKDMNDSKNWPLDFTTHSNTKKRSAVPFKHYYEVGDCFAVNYNDSCFGLLLFDIVNLPSFSLIWKKIGIHLLNKKT